MDKYLNLLNLEKITEGMKKAYEKYKVVNSGFWVTSLSFYTIVALAPVAAILFSLGSWFGAKDYILNKITESTPLPKEVVELISSFAENLLKNARGGVLAGVGFIFLGWTFIKMFSLIEDSFNDIWHIKTPRTMIRRISDYISFFIFLPLLLIVINGVLLFVMSKIENISILSYFLSKIIPYISLLIFFGSFYIVIPNTNVKIIPGMISALVTSIIFSVFQFTFFRIQGLINNYSVIYGSFSVIFIFLLWIRAFWFLIILGVHLSYLLQNSGLDLNENDSVQINFNSRLYITLKVFEKLVKAYEENLGSLTFEDLKKDLKISSFLMENILESLIKKEFLISGINEKNEKIYSITKNISMTNLKEIYEITAEYGEKIFVFSDNFSDEIEKIILNQDYNRKLQSLGGKL